jgi:hypothetical protein
MLLSSAFFFVSFFASDSVANSRVWGQQGSHQLHVFKVLLVPSPVRVKEVFDSKSIDPH